MEDKVIQEGNRLIAEFMGWKFLSDGNVTHEDHTDHGQLIPLRADILQYHSSWSWLMPVCHKINSNESAILVEMNGVKDSIAPYINAMRLMKKGAINFDLQKTWEGVIRFIRWYNQQNQLRQ